MALTKAFRRRLPWVIAAGLIVFALAAWLVLGAGATAVETAEVEQGPAVELVYATGYVEARRPVSVSARLTAPVRQVLAEEGARVNKGQALILLDDAEQRGLLAQSEAQARGATLAEQRAVSLFRQGWVTRAARDEAVAAGQAARASAAALRARLDQTTVRAGISGVVLKRDVEPGDLATPGKELMQLGDPGSARVTATVDERDIPRVQVGQNVLMSTDAMPGKVIRGQVTEITPGGDPTQRAFRVRIGLDDASALPFGLTLEVNIVTGRHDKALLVPVGAVDSGQVWLVKDGRAVARKVGIGIEGAEKVEILSGLAVGDRVVVNPPDGLEDGDRVRP
ncbi:efflux transporter periplasmic adaptor subunit [Croceicoccus estronivorus]|uniref:efflux RND transporter periplasmic adaptor subunit n=1 Tax=Croceicoccus estronivorus TaxID=1172626 RepID=UPI00082F7805|nr:efflux RND transporter periplasmic adaptor subunit [Croceicoccus estronivorus]OCC25477.1 efflux transporter periplasmic adaptor subunit [Croceicoccus estronivorus]